MSGALIRASFLTAPLDPAPPLVHPLCDTPHTSSRAALAAVPWRPRHCSRRSREALGSPSGTRLAGAGGCHGQRHCVRRPSSAAPLQKSEKSPAEAQRRDAGRRPLHRSRACARHPRARVYPGGSWDKVRGPSCPSRCKDLVAPFAAGSWPGWERAPAAPPNPQDFRGSLNPRTGPAGGR